MSVESWMINLGAGIATFIATFAVLKNRHTQLEERVSEMLNDGKSMKNTIFKKIDDLKETSITHKEKISSLQMKLENLDEKYMTDKEVEAKYLQREIFEREMRRIDEKFEHLEKKFDEKLGEVNNTLKSILEELKKR